jgi:hypothetical protein
LLKCDLATMSIKTVIHLEAWNIANTHILSVPNFTHCVLNNCEVNNSVFLDFITNNGEKKY